MTATEDPREPSSDDRDRWNEEAAFEAEQQANEDWAHEMAVADWFDDLEASE